MFSVTLNFILKEIFRFGNKKNRYFSHFAISRPIVLDDLLVRS